MVRCKLTVFKPSGKYYTEEEIKLPDKYVFEIFNQRVDFPLLNRYNDMYKVVTLLEDADKLIPFMIPSNK